MTITTGAAVPDAGVAGWAVDLMEALGGPGAGLAIALENLFPPLPSEVVLPLAGFTASRGEFTLAGALFWTTLGSVVGALALYGLGAGLGRDRARALLLRLPLVRGADVDRAEAWFARHGAAAVLLGRMVPVVRSLVSLPAGTQRMPLVRFTALTAVGSLVWNALFVGAGYALGENWDAVAPYAGALQKGVLGLVVLAVGYLVVTRVRAGVVRSGS